MYEKNFLHFSILKNLHIFSSTKPSLVETTETPTQTNSNSTNLTKLGYPGENPTPTDPKFTGISSPLPRSPSGITSQLGNLDSTKLIGYKGENPMEPGFNDLDSTDSAMVYAMSVQFLHLYNATSAFNIKDLSPTEMAKVF